MHNFKNHQKIPRKRESKQTFFCKQTQPGYVVFQRTNVVVVIFDSLFKSGKSGAQWYCLIPSILSALCPGYQGASWASKLLN